MLLNIFTVFLLTRFTTAVRVLYIPDVVLISVSNASSVTLTDRTCDQCLCASNFSDLILNCFPNATCQFFATSPRTYRLQSVPNALLYFPKGIYPNASQCCMPNTTSLLSQLNATNSTSVSANSSRCLILDNNGYLVAVSYGAKSILRFHPNNLTAISVPASPIFTTNPWSITNFNEAHYVAFDSSIGVFNSSSMALLHNISAPGLNGTRDMMFINGGQSMIAASSNNARLFFFNRSSAGSYNYNPVGFQNVSYSSPHGLTYVSDTFFYATSWSNNSIYSYSRSGSATTWTEKFVLSAWSTTGSPAGSHLSVDECGRFWFSLGNFGLRVFDSQGTPLGATKPTGSYVFDTILLENYVMYVSGIGSNKILRIDPNISCYVP